MAAEFDGSVFAAVDAFFQDKPGNDDNKNQHHHTHHHPKKASTSSFSKSNRLGVGASSLDQKSNQQSSSSSLTLLAGSTAAKRLLQVGSKKKRKRETTPDDDDDHSSSSSRKNGKEEDDDDDEDLGRTAIAASRKVSLSAANEATATENIQKSKTGEKKKKKKGKKERHQQQEATTTTNLPNEAANTDEPKNAAAVEKACSELVDDNGNKNVASEEEVIGNTVEKKQPKHRHRKKVRSRQKNIFKDRREIKPPHLIPGATPQYRGRPLTTETKAKLQPQQENQEEDGKDRQVVEEPSENGDPGERVLPLASSSERESVNVAVETEQSPVKHETEATIAKKKAKTKKSKYKNLV